MYVHPLGPDGFRASIWEWLAYAGGSTVLVSLYHWFTAPAPPPLPPEPTGGDVPLDELAKDWPTLQRWVSEENPADGDLLGNRRVADRLAAYLVSGGGTVGLVGKFGSGKTTIVRWLKARLDRHNRDGNRPSMWVCEVSCWGFEDPAAAVQHILSRAVAEVGRHVDCFSIRHLPEAYRKTFSAGGDWLRNVLDLLLGSADPLDQFRSLSGILLAVEARLVVVVEDLDRTSSTRFDRQEVLALLQRLKEVDRVCFVLASGQTSARDIDFAKLCTHIELIRSCDVRWSMAVLRAVRTHSQAAHQDVAVGRTDEDPWDPVIYSLVESGDRLSLPTAAAQLLDTPRTLKHALRQTHRAWGTLHGEVRFDHLLAANILRHGAPGAFDFLLRNRGRLLSTSPRAGGEDRTEAAFAALKEDWQHTVRDVPWNPQSALVVMALLFPQTARLHGNRGYVDQSVQPQGVSEERYWLRVVNEEVDPRDVRDQDVLRDATAWLKAPVHDAPLVSRLCAGGPYVKVWESYAQPFFTDQESSILLLGEHVLGQLLATREAEASGLKAEEGADAVRRIARRLLGEGRRLSWLAARLNQAMPISLLLALEVHSRWADPQVGIGSIEDQQELRRVLHEAATAQFTSGELLLRVLHPQVPYDLFWLVYPPRESGAEQPLRGVEHWGWLGPAILDALRLNTDRMGARVAYLISDPQPTDHPAIRVHRVSRDRLEGFFGKDAGDVVRLLAQARDRATGDDRQVLDQVVRSAEHLPPPAENATAQ